MQKKIIFSIIAIIVILVVVFLSRQANSSYATTQAKDYVAKGSNWIASKIYPAISGEVQKRGDMIKNEVTQEKQKVSENIGQKISNYFSGVADSVLHPGTPQNCPTQPNPN